MGEKSEAVVNVPIRGGVYHRQGDGSLKQVAGLENESEQPAAPAPPADPVPPVEEQV